MRVTGILAFADTHDDHAIFAKSVQLLSERGIESVVFDPCNNAPDRGDFFSVIQANVENLRAVFEPQTNEAPRPRLVHSLDRHCGTL